jgi:hypothetical protein
VHITNSLRVHSVDIGAGYVEIALILKGERRRSQARRNDIVALAKRADDGQAVARSTTTKCRSTRIRTKPSWRIASKDAFHSISDGDFCFNSSVDELDHVPQHNAAMLEQATAVAYCLDNEASVLTEQIKEEAKEKGSDRPSVSVLFRCDPAPD